MSGVTSETAPVILARRSTTSAGKGGKYALYLTNSHKKKKVLRRTWEEIYCRRDICRATSGSYIKLQLRYVGQNLMYGYIYLYTVSIYHLLIKVHTLSKLHSYF
jgi:hypothetical protein